MNRRQIGDKRKRGPRFLYFSNYQIRHSCYRVANLKPGKVPSFSSCVSFPRKLYTDRISASFSSAKKSQSSFISLRISRALPRYASFARQTHRTMRLQAFNFHHLLRVSEMRYHRERDDA